VYYNVNVSEIICGDRDLILIVDDDGRIAEMIEELVEEHGCPHVSFSDPREALDYYKRNSRSVNVVITDSIMAHMSGPDLVREVRVIDPKVSVILATNYEGEPVPDNVVPLVSSILTKPFTHAELLGALRTALARGDG